MVVLIVLAALAGLILLAAYYAYRTAFYARPGESTDVFSLPDGEQYREHEMEMIALIRELRELESKTVTIESFDGLTLVGHYFHVRDGAPLQIQFHGYRGSGVRDFCGGNKLARELGHNTLVVDQRAHGESEGTTIAFGINERRDCLDWVQYAIDRFGPQTKIVLAGVSMGAATVLMAAGLELPEQVVCVIADSPYTSPKEIICKVAGEMGLPAKLAFPFVRLGAWLFGRFDVTAADTLTAVAKAKVPILLIHGEADHFVPYEMSRLLQHAAGLSATLETFPDAGHGISYIVDPERYRDVTVRFLQHCGL